MVTIVDPDERWPAEFERIAGALRSALGSDASRIDHIGSTSVPGLPAKDVIDIQVTVADTAALDRTAGTLEALGWRRGIGFDDHPVPGLPADPSQWQKEFLREPSGHRPTHVHIRIDGRANQRYALLFRDYLREHADAATAYAQVKRGLASLTTDPDAYSDAKDPACDLVYRAAEEWVDSAGWTTGGGQRTLRK